MATKPKNEIQTEAGPVTIDHDAEYKVVLAHSVSYLGHVMRPRDRNIKVRGSALLTIAADAPGAFVNVSQV